ncbi:MAG: tRNA preQ1(34) S-adenosylmethionine ribosyltransferase-isomerase QueA [Endomicrobiia bacterium]|nr:tRNA preQ1(34) S-adenosylmethionine ribosyltransferase-isomerase QueA [Endomicrobiia bacterium]
MLKVSDYDFALPEELIAQRPAKTRDAARLMIVERKTSNIRHRTFADFADYFKAGDCLVINATKVMPVRVFGRKKTGGRVEVLFIADGDKALIKPSLAEGESIFFDDGTKTLVGHKDDSGAKEIIFPDGVEAKTLIEKYGIMPLPHYIKRKNADEETINEDRKRYQTVYAQSDGSIAAPTAGLHFTDDILKDLEGRGIDIARVVLHVGLGTFKSVKSPMIDAHKMLPERFSLSDGEAAKINRAAASGATIAAVGTTSARTIETLADKHRGVRAGEGATSLYIYPGYSFKTVGRLLTNFHLPRSTPLFLAAAFCGKDLLFEAYRRAIKERYRFFSYGDAMLII